MKRLTGNLAVGSAASITGKTTIGGTDRPGDSIESETNILSVHGNMAVVGATSISDHVTIGAPPPASLSPLVGRTADRLTVHGGASIGGHTRIEGGLTAQSSACIAGPFSATSAEGNIFGKGSVFAGNVLSIIGSTTVDGDFSARMAANIGGMATIGTPARNNTLVVNGCIKLRGETIIGASNRNLLMVNATTTISGALAAKSKDGNVFGGGMATQATTLTVNGNTTVNGDLTVCGNANITGYWKAGAEPPFVTYLFEQIRFSESAGSWYSVIDTQTEVAGVVIGNPHKYRVFVLGVWRSDDYGRRVPLVGHFHWYQPDYGDTGVLVLDTNPNGLVDVCVLFIRRTDSSTSR